MHKITQVEAMEGYHISLSFADGTSGEVDLSDLAGRGVFAACESTLSFRK